MNIFFAGVHRPSEVKMIRDLRRRLNLLTTYFDIYQSPGGARIFFKTVKVIKGRT